MLFLSRRSLITVFGLLFLVPGLLYVGWMKSMTALATMRTGHSPIVLAVAVELTGPVGSWGQAAFKGIQMAVDEANSQGGIEGHPVQTISADASDGAGLAGLSEQAQKNGVAAVIGPVTPSKAEALVKAGLPVPLISLATASTVPSIGDKVLQGSYDDRQQGAAAAQYAARVWSKKAALVVEEKSAYAQSLAKAFRETYEEKGGKIVKSLTYQRGQQDFSALIQQLSQADPEVIYLPGYAKEGKAFLQQARQKGLQTPVIGGDGLESVAKEIAGKEKEAWQWRLYYTTPNFIPTGEAAAFVQTYQSRYSEAPQPMALWAYDATRGILNGLRSPEVRANPDALLRQMAGAGWPVAGGRMRIDENRHAWRPMAIMGSEPDLRLVEVIPAAGP
ncbi:ABC transporter substrate-binding protein [Heliobacterium gestii]|uniref:ABC transporter substrate-binding protein n=1 Tax=Heliomicrobium gestii TaxID=2699 RepID=A0A845LF08_HELGE|nr:ABC transporter substrate-binding protein [Heliomicrobium gestii]MBM7867758.1 branched-chain amino acid transport system substrate-binding protein [Heliomicrobium gestii]MZP44151.1 ABC transporter substrate-binding protein [Heliomicrobium gestii]